MGLGLDWVGLMIMTSMGWHNWGLDLIRLRVESWCDVTARTGCCVPRTPSPPEGGFMRQHLTLAAAKVPFFAEHRSTRAMFPIMHSRQCIIPS